MPEMIALDEFEAARDRAIAELRAGRVVLAPTDTVYALLANAFDDRATRQLARVKRRDRKQPLSVLIRSPRQVVGLVSEVPEAADRLMASYWPGPLTLVLPAAEGLSWDLGDTGGTVALRMPADELTLAVIADIGPLACSAANRDGQPIPSTVEEAQQQLPGVAVAIDGGARAAALSTIVDVTRGRTEVLRAGAIPAEDVAQVASGAVGWGQRPDDEAPEPAPVSEEVSEEVSD